jgi:hypothetical protein
MRRIALAVPLAAAALVASAPSAGAYPGPDGYDAGYCYAGGLRLDASNYFYSTGQEIHTDVDDNTSSNYLVRVSYSSPLWVGTHSGTTLSDVYRYRANKTEVMTLTLRTGSGATCSLRLDGSM